MDYNPSLEVKSELYTNIANGIKGIVKLLRKLILIWNLLIVKMKRSSAIAYYDRVKASVEELREHVDFLKNGLMMKVGRFQNTVNAIYYIVQKFEILVKTARSINFLLFVYLNILISFTVCQKWCNMLKKGIINYVFTGLVVALILTSRFPVVERCQGMQLLKRKCLKPLAVF